MSEEFNRENRYLVLKRKDIDKWLTAEKKECLHAIAKQIADEREAAYPWKPSLECVVVESDWSIYEQVWKLVELEAQGIAPDDRIATLERELSDAKEREVRLRAHIQEAADDAQSNEMAAAVNGETYQVTYFKKLRDWHLAALEQNNG